MAALKRYGPTAAVSGVLALAAILTADLLDGGLRAVILGLIVGIAVGYERPRLNRSTS